MKQKKALLFVIIISSILAVGSVVLGIFLFTQMINKEIEQVETYIDTISLLNEKDEKFQMELDREFYNEESDEKALNYLEEKGIPNYRSLIKEAKAINISYGDLKEIQDLYIDSNELYLESLLDNKKAIETQKDELYDIAYDKLIEVDNIMVKHDALLEKLAEDNAVELEWE